MPASSDLHNCPCNQLRSAWIFLFIYLFIFLTIAATKIIHLKENQCNLCIEASQALHSVTKDKERRAKKDEAWPKEKRQK